MRQCQDPSNSRCCDSRSTEAQWASVSHGIFISIGAAGVHRSLGVKVSFVQSLTMDSLKPVHLKMMELGGNKRFNDFLREHNIPEDMPIRQKYSTRAAAWYRENLRAMAEGRQAVSAPFEPGTGHLPEEQTKDPHLEAILDQVFEEASSEVPEVASSQCSEVRCPGACEKFCKQLKQLFAKTPGQKFATSDEARCISISEKFHKMQDEDEPDQKCRPAVLRLQPGGPVFEDIGLEDLQQPVAHAAAAA